MDYEKLHKDTITKLQHMVNSGKITVETARGICADFVPESEDERIRKRIIDIVKKSYEQGGYALHKWEADEMLAWIEKQGEQKPVPDWMPKFLDELRSKKNYFDWDEHKDVEGCILAIIEWMNPNYFNEKDGEQKSVDKVEPKFKAGDIVKDPYGDIYHIIEINNDSYKTDDGRFILFKNEDAYRLWTIQDTKAGDLLADDYGIYIFDRFDEWDEKCFYCMGAYQRSQKVYENEQLLCSIEVHPATKEQRDLLFQKIKEAGYEWDTKKKELKKIVAPIFHIGDRIRYKGHKCDGVITEITDTDYICGDAKLPISTQDKLELVGQKSAWSEEDENHVKSILSTIECCKAQFPNAQAVVEAYNADIEWLKNLRPQSHWKPSDLPHWKKSTLPNDNITGFNSDYFCHNGYYINYKELFEKLPKDD